MRTLLAFIVLFFLCVGCTATPPARCQVIPTQDFNGNPPYLARYTVTGETGTCTGVEPLGPQPLGVQAYFVPGENQGRLGLRPARLVDIAQGRVFTADTDATNNCERGAAGEAEPDCASCGLDGGNLCQAVDDPVLRKDPADPSGARLNALGTFPVDPGSDSVCVATGFSGTDQQFAAASVTLLDGGTASFPALPVRYEWDEVKVIARAEVPGTAMTARVTFTEGSCTRTYSMLAFYPLKSCSQDQDCDPEPNPEKGILIGSGINPAFKPRCETTISFCVPTVDVLKPGLPPL